MDEWFEDEGNRKRYIAKFQRHETWMIVKLPIIVDSVLYLYENLNMKLQIQEMLRSSLLHLSLFLASSYVSAASLPTVPTPTRGQWCSDSAASMAYAEANGIPVIAIWGSTSCGYCNAYDTALSDPAFISWRQSTPYIYIYIKNTQDAFYSWMWGTVAGATRKLDAYPFVMYYWKKDGQVLVEQRWVGRESSGNYPLGSPLAGRTRTLAEQYFAAYSSVPLPTDAWDTNDDTRSGTTNIISMSQAKVVQGPHYLNLTDTNDWIKLNVVMGMTNVLWFSNVMTNNYVSGLTAKIYLENESASYSVLTNLQGTFRYFNTSAATLSIRVSRNANTNSAVSYSLNYAVVNDVISAVGVNATLLGVTSAVMVHADHSGATGTSLRLGGLDLLDDGQMAGIEWSVEGPGVLSFDWKVSSEEDWDWLSFYEMGAPQTNQISGVTEWASQSVTVLGEPLANHTFRWEYEKDPIGDYVGEDCGWVDSIVWTPLYILSVNSGTGAGYYTNSALLSITADAPPANSEFDRWTGNTSTIANVFAGSTTLRMPSANTAVTATYKPLSQLTVNSGTGDGYYTNNASVTITADSPQAHYEFDRWTGDTNTVANIFSASTTLVLLNTNAVVTATYKPITSYMLDISNGTGGGTYPYATAVEIRASSFPNKRFFRWTGDVGSVADVNAATTTVVTADHTISVTATYSVPLTVNSGTGSGWYPEGSTTTVSADADPLWKEFAVWSGDAGLLSNANARTTTLTLPTAPATVTASYKDSVSRLTGSYGRTYSESGTEGAISSDAAAGALSGTPAVKLGGSGVISDNGFVALETVVSGSGSIIFQWKVSSELNGDYLKFKVDGSEVAAISGTKGPWTQVSNRVDTAGEHTLRWEYVKNGSISSSTDAGWVDDIIWIGDEQEPSLAPVIVNAVLTNQNMTIQFTGERGITYLVQTNGTLDQSGWGDYQTLQPTWINESNGVHRFEIVPSAFESNTLFYRVVTPSPVIPAGMVAIPAGTNSGTDPDFGVYSLTNAAKFYMDATEVTKAKWDEVYTWAVAHGYSFTNAGLGKASSHPVHTVDWYDCVKWCNARSQKEGKTPCYNLSDWSCNFLANGYRLPTNTEWEYAARGGLSGKRFPWGDIIDHTRANYYGYPPEYAYDQGYEGYDTRYATDDPPYTSPAGAFAANGYGLYDMVGNVWEWCNDSSGSYRSVYGGSWDDSAGYARCRDSLLYFPVGTNFFIGFRSVCR